MQDKLFEKYGLCLISDNRDGLDGKLEIIYHLTEGGKHYATEQKLYNIDFFSKDEIKSLCDWLYDNKIGLYDNQHREKNNIVIGNTHTLSDYHLFYYDKELGRVAVEHCR